MRPDAVDAEALRPPVEIVLGDVRDAGADGCGDAAAIGIRVEGLYAGLVLAVDHPAGEIVGVGCVQCQAPAAGRSYTQSAFSVASFSNSQNSDGVRILIPS